MKSARIVALLFEPSGAVAGMNSCTITQTLPAKATGVAAALGGYSCAAPGCRLPVQPTSAKTFVVQPVMAGVAVSLATLKRTCPAVPAVKVWA
ncbi:hypothetical protein D9M69_563310 [compost metagenome]